ARRKLSQTNREKSQPEQNSQEEVVVVGGSAAGLYTAAKVAQGGKRVRVLESKRGLEPVARTLIVTDHFRSQLGASPHARVLLAYRRFELVSDWRSTRA